MHIYPINPVQVFPFYQIYTLLYYNNKTILKECIGNLFVVLTIAYLKFEIHFIHKIEKNCFRHKWSIYLKFVLYHVCCAWFKKTREVTHVCMDIPSKETLHHT